MEDCAPLVPDSSTLIMQMYNAHPTPPLLDLGKQVRSRKRLMGYLPLRVLTVHVNLFFKFDKDRRTIH